MASKSHYGDFSNIFHFDIKLNIITILINSKSLWLNFFQLFKKNNKILIKCIKFCHFRSITLLIGQLLMICVVYLNDVVKSVTFTSPEIDTPVKVAALHLFGELKANSTIIPEARIRLFVLTFGIFSVPGTHIIFNLILHKNQLYP